MKTADGANVTYPGVDFGGLESVGAAVPFRVYSDRTMPGEFQEMTAEAIYGLALLLSHLTAYRPVTIEWEKDELRTFWVMAAGKKYARCVLAV